MKVGFEQPSDFEVDMTSPIWNTSANRWHLYMDDPNYPNVPNKMEPTMEQVRSGSYSCKLSLLNPIDNHSRIINIERNWHPINDTEIWFECWYYLPNDFVFEEWVNLHRTLAERLWKGTEYLWFQLTEGINRYAQYNSEDLQIFSNLEHGNLTGLNSQFITTPDFIRRGEWFGIRTYVKRESPLGIYKLWLNTPRLNDWTLQWEYNTRTIGIDPNRILSIGDNLTGDKAWIASGIALYCGPVPAVPKYCYYDDVIFGSENMSEQTDSNGKFSMNLQPGNYNITVTKAGLNDGSASITINAGQTTTQDFTLSFQDGILSGQVMDAGGNPVEQATVTATLV